MSLILLRGAGPSVVVLLRSAALRDDPQHSASRQCIGATANSLLLSRVAPSGGDSERGLETRAVLSRAGSPVLACGSRVAAR